MNPPEDLPWEQRQKTLTVEKGIPPEEFEMAVGRSDAASEIGELMREARELKERLEAERFEREELERHVMALSTQSSCSLPALLPEESRQNALTYSGN